MILLTPWGFGFVTVDSLGLSENSEGIDVAEAYSQYESFHQKEQKMVDDVIRVLQDWWGAKQNGTANLRHPSLNCGITQEEADEQVRDLDAYSAEEWEQNYYYHERPEHSGATGPWHFFDCLAPHARVAMVEALWEAKGILRDNEVERP